MRCSRSIALAAGARHPSYLGIPSRRWRAGLFAVVWVLLAGPTLGDVRIDYDARSRLEPDSPSLGLDFSSVRSGGASFPNQSGGPLLTIDDETDDDRGGGGRYYRRQLTRDEFDDTTDLRIEVTVKVLASVGSPAATCVQFTTRDGRTFGLGFLRDEAAREGQQIVLYADRGEPLPPIGGHGNVDWMWQPAVLGVYDMTVDVRRTYVLQLQRAEAGPEDDLVSLEVPGSGRKPLVARLADLPRRVTVPGLVFGAEEGRADTLVTARPCVWSNVGILARSLFHYCKGS